MIEVRKHENSNWIDEIVSQDTPVHLEQIDSDTFWLGFGHGDDLQSFLITIKNGDELMCIEQE